MAALSRKAQSIRIPWWPPLLPVILDGDDTVTFSLTSGNDQGYFAIDSSTGVVTLTQAGVDAINSDAGVRSDQSEPGCHRQ